MKAQLVLENVGVRFPHRVLFDQVNWTLYEGMRVTLAGRNGCGKSTLMRILAGYEDPPEGDRAVVGGRKLRIGYLDQKLLDTAVLTAQKSDLGEISVVKYVDDHLLKDKEEHVETEWEIKRILMGLGFTENMLGDSPQKLSGGWLLRMFIGATLLNRPEVLLLDEPTNHLDISTIQWLETFLTREYKGTLVLISHDVELQKRTTDSLAILHGGHFYFRKHQSDYLSFRDSLSGEAEMLEKNLERTQKKHKELIDFVNRFRAKARSASRAQSKLRAAEKVQEEIDEIKDRIERIRGASYNLHFHFRSQHQGGKFPLVLKDMDFRYGEGQPWILKNTNLDVKRGQKIAIIGDNGAGKTTLLKVMAQVLEPTEGELQTGHNVDTGFFGQHQLDELSLDEDLVENLRQKAPTISREQLRAWLGAFGFSGEYEISKKAKVLSGGERARLALLRILVTPVNLVLLDEPTNHLDIETKELLKNAIRSFEGTVIFVSHDREFIGSIAERILYLSHDHKLTDHIGNLTTFFQKYPDLQIGANPVKPKQVSTQTAESTLSYEERKKKRNRIKSLEKKVATLEQEIESLGEEKEKLQSETEKPGFYDPKNETQRNEVFASVARCDQTLTKKMIEWEKFGQELEQLKKD